MQIHEHIIIHGNLVKPTKINVAGIEVDTEEMVEQGDEGAVDKVCDAILLPPVPQPQSTMLSAAPPQGTKELANRQSFIIMRDRMQKDVGA